MKRNNLFSAVALTLLLFFAGPALADEMRGAIKSVQPDSKTFVLIDRDLAEHSFRLADDARITVEGRAADLNDLESGNTVTVTFEERDGQRVVTGIRWETP